MSDAEIGPDGELLRRDAEGEIGFWGWHEEVGDKGLVIDPTPADISPAIQLTILDPDLREEDRQALINLANAGLLGEGAEIVLPEDEYPQIIGQLALEGPEFDPESVIDEPEEIETIPDNPAVIAEGLREAPKTDVVEAEKKPPEGNDVVIRNLRDGLEMVGVKIETTDDGEVEVTL